MFNFSIRRVVTVLVAVGVVGLSSYAFLGSITGLETAGRAGAATQTVSGYAISSVSYTYDSTDPNLIDSVGFTLDGPASMVKARLAAAGPYHNCIDNAPATASVRAVSGQETWTAFVCDSTAPQATVLAQDELSVVAHS
ncbi:MAG: hypothetical protein QOF68_1084 [Gaiellales bacterium]|jgi:hypothetical protein|nr:hypothetical protein [Gaiellales bacterium]